MNPVLLVGYLTLFVAAAAGLVFVALLLAKLLRPSNPTPVKLQTYECGEPSVGPADVQFDIRFYVVALVFLIFDVEVAVFFPWATVFGKATHLAAAANPEAGQIRLRELGMADNQPRSGLYSGRQSGDGARQISAEQDSSVAEHRQDLGQVGYQFESSPVGNKTGTNGGASGTKSDSARRSAPDAAAAGPEPPPQADAAGETVTTSEVRRVGQHLTQLAIVDIAVFFGVLLVGFAYVWSRGDLTWNRAAPPQSQGEWTPPGPHRPQATPTSRTQGNAFPPTQGNTTSGSGPHDAATS